MSAIGPVGAGDRVGLARRRPGPRRSAARSARRPPSASRAASRCSAVSTIISTNSSDDGQRDHADAGRLRKRRQAARQTPSDARARLGARGRASAGRRSLEHHPRVDQLVEHVDREVDEHRDHRQVDREGLDHRIVAAVDGQDAPRGRRPGSRRTPRSGTSRRRCPAAPARRWSGSGSWRCAARA